MNELLQEIYNSAVRIDVYSRLQTEVDKEIAIQAIDDLECQLKQLRQWLMGAEVTG